MNGSPPPAAVVVTWPIELVGADDTVPPTELLVVSRLLVVALTVVVVAPLVEVAPEVLVAPLVVVGLTVVVVAPLVVVGLTVVVVAPVLVVGLTVVVVAPVLVVGYAVVVVDPLVVVVPPELVAEASCPTLTPANAIKVTAISQAAIRLRSFVACLAIDPTFRCPRDRWIAPTYRATKQPLTPVSVLAGKGKTRIWQCEPGRTSG